MHSSPLHRNGEWLDIRHEIHSYHKLLLHVQSSDVTDSSHTDLSHLNPYRLQRPVRHDNHLGFLIRIAVYCEFCATLLSSELRCCPIFGHPPVRESTRLNSSHVRIAYAVFCLKKKKQKCI